MIIILSETSRLQFKEKFVSELYLSGMIDRSISTRSNASLIEMYRVYGQFSIEGYFQKVVLCELSHPELSEYYEVVYRQFGVGVACGCGESLTFNSVRYIQDKYPNPGDLEKNSVDVWSILHKPPGFKCVR